MGELSNETKLSDKVYKILIVDDDQNLIDSVALIIKSEIIERISIHESTDAEDAMNSASKNKYDLMIIDYKLPKINGDELIRYVRNSDLNKECPIIFVSGYYTQFEDSKVVDSFKKVIYIKKPFNVNHLSKHLKSQLFSSNKEL
ncbi:MAG: response regulator [Oligoflexales bacterium]